MMPIFSKVSSCDADHGTNAVLNNGVGMSQSIGPSFSFPKFNSQSFVKPHFQVQIKAQVERSSLASDAEPQKILGARLLDRLDKVLNTEGLGLKGLEKEDYTPAKVSDRIMSSILAAYGQLRQARPEANTDRFFSQVKDGLEKGFSEAKDILQNLGMLQGKIAEDVNNTYDLTMRGLDKLASQAKLASTNETTVNPRVDTTMRFQNVAIQQSRSAEIQVKTREGDTVTISFSQSASSSRSALQVRQGDSSLQAFQESYSENSDFSISIEGDLNQDEQKSLQKLMKKMQKVSDAFFHGSGKAAVQHAQKLGFNDQQIAGFSMDLSMRNSVQAVAAYQQTSAPQQTVQPDLLAQAGDFMNQAKTMLADAQTSLQSLAEPRQSFQELFSGIGLLTSQSSTGAEESGDQALFSGVVDKLSENVSAAEVQEAA